MIYERDKELEEFLDSLSPIVRDVFKYMREEYERITNYGEIYNPKQHDPMVAKFASRRFNIQAKEAAEICVNVQIMIGEFQIKRLEKELVLVK
ncbi:hypothetical protein [Priestia abyssalis]|uniref:hypothetical protein n=1 Tax=Priestia abyssalis TaxID=1221450 RepID=UPI000994C3FD|nr:hypothetical protein [Priestia abyssalis]